MPDLAFMDPRLTAVYDTFNASDDDTNFYLRLAGAAPLRVLDMGCGTGRLTLCLAELGHEVTGADPAKAMLAVARRKPGAARVTWIETDAAGMAVDGRFDLIIMTGHAFQVFLTNEEIHEALVNLRRHLAVNGRLAFETRNPAAREWEGWTRDQTTEQADIPGVGPVTIYYQTQSATNRFVTFHACFRFGEEAMIEAPSTLRFMDQAELAAYLQKAGFTNMEWLGNWDGAPLQLNSPEIIVIAS
ncbi:MAG: class I SAM-dependent methyltransferase [Ardenticatenaceae bacterium]|nr:class I SAM-dependent methyltransferase [Ardenticatenaceae bacterium]